MSELDFEYSVDTEYSLQGMRVARLDTTIFSVPAEVIEDGETNHGWLAEFSGVLAAKQAGDLGEVLHHADFVVTSDPAVIEARGVMHDCEDCRRSARDAIRYVTENPDQKLVIGTLFWCECQP